MFAQYCRLNVHVEDSNRVVIRAALRRLSVIGRSYARRKWRHRWLRMLMREHADARDLYDRVWEAR